MIGVSIAGGVCIIWGSCSWRCWQWRRIRSATICRFFDRGDRDRDVDRHCCSGSIEAAEEYNVLKKEETQYGGITMISYVRGELTAVEKDKVIVDVGGVGYGVFMPEASMGMLPQMGEEIKLHTYLNVREDAMQLFGFLTRDDLEVFRLLIGVSGIGPKGGLSILSS